MLAGARDFWLSLFQGGISKDSEKGFSGRKQRLAHTDWPGQKRKSEVITVFGTKGGVGKTTIAVNLAVLLAQRKQKVALLDLDLQFGDVSVF